MATNVRPRITITKFESSGNGYRIYRDKVTLWAAVCGLEKKNLGTVIWLKLPRIDPSNIKELILAKVGPDKLNSDEGLAKFLEAMVDAFKPNSQS